MKNMSAELSGRVALVTGAGRGIGRAIALALAQRGADVAVNYHCNDSAAQEVCTRISDLGTRAVAVRANVGNASEVAGLVEAVRRELGPITILVNNAGIALRRTSEDIAEQDWDEVLKVNLKAPFLVTQAVLPDMRAAGWGRIISLSSVAAQIGGAVGPHYAASKGGASSV